MSIISKKLLLWYDEHHRILPWRISPSKTGHTITPNPYHIWLSEIMLQQTQVVTVIGYYNRWMERYAMPGSGTHDLTFIY